MKSKRILICDDHSIFTHGLNELLKLANQKYIVSTVNDSKTCEEFLYKNKFDVFICDLNIDNQDGFTLILKMKDYLKSTRIIIISAYCESYLIDKARKMGILGFIKKDSSLNDLIDAIESNLPFFTNIENIEKLNNEFTELDKKFNGKFKLSKQEKLIIQLIITGKTSKEIGESLFISKTTVDTHRRNINRKLGVTNVSSLYKFVHENQLLD